MASLNYYIEERDRIVGSLKHCNKKFCFKKSAELKITPKDLLVHGKFNLNDFPNILLIIII